MSISVPKNITADWRNVEQEDLTANRKIQIKNIQRQTAEMKPIWKESQQKLYGNMLDITPDVTLGEVLITEGLSATNAENNRAIAFRYLTKISDETIAEYIIDRLSPEELLYLVVNFTGIIRNLKKMNAKLDKDIFISRVQQLAIENPVDANERNLSQMGEQNQTRKKLANERSRKQQQDEIDLFDERMAGISKEGDEISRRNTVRKQKLINRELNLRNQKNVETGIPRMIQQMEQRMFDLNADKVLNKSAEIARLRQQGRSRMGQIQDSHLRNANDSAPVTVGVGSVDYANPTTPSGRGNSRISPRNQPLTSESLYDVYGASPPVSNQNPRRSGRQRKPPIRLAGGKLIYGRGFNLSETSLKNRHYLSEKFYLEKHRLKDNVLSVKYSKTDANLPTIKVQNISNEVKQLIEDVMNDKYNERLFEQLTPNDKRVFKRFVKGTKLDISINDESEKEFQKNYQILKGEFESGNNAPEVKNALKKFILEGLAENKINKNECHFLLYQLSL